MAKDSIYKPIDHFIQGEIITRLAAADKPIRFSDLKEAGIENSLFMYHANKLISRGLIQKTDRGFILTLKGARWTNYVDTTHDLTPPTPRPLIQFIVENTSQNILLGVRRGSLKNHLNDYLLPGNIYRHGLSLTDNTTLILKELFGESHAPVATPVTTADVIHTSDDGFVSHVIVYVFRIQINSKKIQPIRHPLFTTEWVLASGISQENPQYKRSEFLPLLFERLSSIAPHETFLINI